MNRYANGAESDNERQVETRGFDPELVRDDRAATGLTRDGASRILPRRFDAKIGSESETGCWPWRGYVGRDGYGRVKHAGKTTTPHRAVYEILVGPVVAEDVDHLCRVRHCVNPAHLEPVSHRENARRGYAPAGLNARKTHCKRGHEFTPENTIPHGNGNRNCRACFIERLGRVPRSTTRRKLTAAQVSTIRLAVGAGTAQAALAMEMGVSRGCISLIVAGKRHVSAEVAS